MKKVNWGATEIKVPAVTLGCMRLEALNVSEAAKYLEKAVSLGIDFFDHADIYGQGRCETLFGQALAQTDIKREDIWIQSKCGIVSGVMYDFSKEHILKSAEGILKRLNVEYLDSLLLHRPDALMEPEEVAAAFDQLADQGKVRHFGVSNHNSYQIELLNKYLGEDNPIVVNQLQFSLTNTTMIDSGLNVNMENGAAVNRDDSVLDYCRLHDITIQPWSPFQYGFFEGCFIDNPKFPKLNAKLDELAEKYGVANTTIAMAWLLRHPAKLQPVTGTINPKRIVDCAKAADITLTREE